MRTARKGGATTPVESRRTALQCIAQSQQQQRSDISFVVGLLPTLFAAVSVL